MELSAFAPCGLLELSSRQSRAETRYEAMKKALGSGFDFTEGTHVQASTYARAMQLAYVDATLERGANQRTPEFVEERLPSMEFDFRVVPGDPDTLNDRRAALKAKYRVSLGAKKANLIASLLDILGDTFIELVFPVDPTPTSPADLAGSYPRLDVEPKRFVFAHSITQLGVPVEFTYKRRVGDDDGLRLAVGDKVYCQAGNSAIAETVTIAAVRNTTPYPSATATFTKVKENGASLRVGSSPTWRSNGRMILVVVTSAAARDPETRRKIHAVMRDLTREVTGWAVIEPTSPTTAGPFLIGVSPIGATPLETVAL